MTRPRPIAARACLVLVGPLALLMGCSAALSPLDSDIPAARDGVVYLSPEAMARYERYLASPDPGLFIVDLGGATDVVRCDVAGCGQELAEARAAGLKHCRQSTIGCSVIAIGRTPLVTVSLRDDDRLPDNLPAGLDLDSEKDLNSCEYSLNSVCEEGVFCPLFTDVNDCYLSGGFAEGDNRLPIDDLDSWPWQALALVRSTMRDTGQLMSCSGTLVADDVVLTNMHCIEGADPRSVRFGAAARGSNATVLQDNDADIEIVAFWTAAGFGELPVDTRRPLPDGQSLNEDDWALLQLAEPVSGIKPIPIRILSEDEWISLYQGKGTLGTAGYDSTLGDFVMQFGCTVEAVSPKFEGGHLWLDTNCLSRPSNSGSAQLLVDDQGVSLIAVIVGNTIPTSERLSISLAVPARQFAPALETVVSAPANVRQHATGRADMLTELNELDRSLAELDDTMQQLKTANEHGQFTDEAYADLVQTVLSILEARQAVLLDLETMFTDDIITEDEYSHWIALLTRRYDALRNWTQ